jgi:hypothetical protein
VLVMVPVPLAGEVAVRVGQPVEKPIRRVECGGTAVTLPRVVSDLVHRHLSKPRPKRALPPPVELGDFAEDEPRLIEPPNHTFTFKGPENVTAY